MVNLQRYCVACRACYEGELAIPKSWQAELKVQLKMQKEKEDSMGKAHPFLLGRPHLTGCSSLDGGLGEAISITQQVAQVLRTPKSQR